MHIVFVTTELAADNHPAGGLGSFTANMARIFNEKGHKVTVILASVKEENVTMDENIHLRTLYIKKPLWNCFDQVARALSSFTKESRDEIRIFLINLYKGRQVKREIKRINQREKIDIIHFCNHGALSLTAKKKIPYVVRISSFLNIYNGGANQPNGSIRYEDNRLSIRDRLEDYALRKAVYAVSPSYLIGGIARESLGVNPKVIESPFVMDKGKWDYKIYNKLLKDRKYIIHYGRLSYFKGTHIVADMAKALLESHPDIVLVLAGNARMMADEEGKEIHPADLVKRKAEEYVDRVIYVGCLGKEQLYPLIENAQICLLPSRMENLPNACIEAMAMGKIVVGTDGASFEQLIDDRKNGFLCVRDDPNSYMEAVKEILHMSVKEREQMSEMAIESTKRFAPEIIYGKYLEFYQEVIENWKYRGNTTSAGKGNV